MCPYTYFLKTKPVLLVLDYVKKHCYIWCTQAHFDEMCGLTLLIWLSYALLKKAEQLTRVLAMTNQ